jgi:D-galactonate transporter
LPVREELQVSTSTIAPDLESRTFAKVSVKLIPFLFLCYIVAFLDRVNVGFAKLQMASDLKYSDTVYSIGAGIFFLGYFVFEVPSNVILEKVGARIWIARIMITWGIISAAFMFVHQIPWGPIPAMLDLTNAEFSFYFLRTLLGVAEAGFFPGIILYLTYWFPSEIRARKVALFMTAIAISNVIGSPVSGGIMQYTDGLGGLRGWQWLFLLEGLPSVVMGFLVFALLPDGPRKAKWLSTEEKDLIVRRVEEDHVAKQELGQKHSLADAFSDGRVWALSLVYFCGVVCFYAVNFWLPTIVQELGIDKKNLLKVGLVSMIPWGFAAVAMVVNGHHSDVTGERRWHSAGGLLVAIVGMLMLSLVGHNPIIGIVGLTLVTSGILSWVATFWSLPTAFLSGTAAAAGIAWINSVGNLGGYVGPLAIGWVRDHYKSSELAFYSLAACALIGAIIILVLRGTERSTASTKAAAAAALRT